MGFFFLNPLNDDMLKIDVIAMNEPFTANVGRWVTIDYSKYPTIIASALIGIGGTVSSNITIQPVIFGPSSRVGRVYVMSGTTQNAIISIAVWFK